ncbi:hypothetical protein C8R43DRAFT_1242679 [Mycena crocata]|nr:hypothetical protein C8R43DRAFT_1242679 [Mycena crocata]
MPSDYYSLNGLTPPLITAAPFKCPECRHTLVLDQSAKPGKNHGRYFISCFKKQHAPFFFFWPRSAIPPPRTAARLAAEASRRPQPAPPASSPSTTEPKCAILTCLKKRVHRMCDQRMCRPHCLANGGCRCHLEDDNPPRPSLPLLPALDSTSVRALDNIATTYPTNPPLRRSSSSSLLSRNQARIFDPRQQEWEREAASLARMQKELAVDSEDDEDENLKNAIALSLAESSHSSSRPHPMSSNRNLDVQAAEQTFILVSWLRHGQSALVKGIQGCRTWPLWIRGGKHDYEYFDGDLPGWIQVKAGHVHTVTQGKKLFVRELGVEGSDEKRYLDSHLTKPSPTPSPIRRLPNNKLKRRILEMMARNDDDEEVAVDRPIKLEPPSPPRAAKRVRIDTTDDDDDVIFVGMQSVPVSLGTKWDDEVIVLPTLPSLSSTASSSSSASLRSLSPDSPTRFPEYLMPKTP